MEDEVEWIRPTALKALIREHRADWRMKKIEPLLRPALVEGVIKAKAKKARMRRTHALSDDVIDDWHVPPHVWADSYNYSSFDLQTDRFTTTAPGSGFRSVELTGLSFDKAQLLDHADISLGPDAQFNELAPEMQPSIQARRKGGRQAGKAGYAHATFVLRIRDDEVLASGGGDSLAALLAEEYAKIGLPQPSPENLLVWARSMAAAVKGEPFQG